MSRPPMTVADLIAALQALGPERHHLEVRAEGCDCINPAIAIDPDSFDDAILIEVEL